MYIYYFWAFVTIWLLQFVVANMLQGRKNLRLGRWNNPLKAAIAELMVFGGVVIISVAYFLYLYITSEPSLFSSFSLYILVCIVVVFANALIKFLRLKRWINKHFNYAILAFDTPTSWIKSIRRLHIGKLDGAKDAKGKAFFYDKSTLVVPGKHEFCFDIQKRSGKTIVHLYSVYMDFNVAPSTMYVLKENEDAKKLYISYSCSAPETNSQP